MELKEKAASGVRWNTISVVYRVILQFLRIAILTRLLDKSDFGLVAIASMVISFTDIFSDLGITVAIIHKQDISDKQYSSIYWLNIIVSVILFGLVWLSSPFIAAFYHEPILTRIIPLLGLSILCQAFGKMFQTIKTKNLEFAFLSKVTILTSTVGLILSIILAALGWGVYSLVWGHVAQIALNQLLYVLAGRKQQTILLHFNFYEIKDFVKIGAYKLGAGILDFASSKIDVFLIGRFFNMDDLGIYNLAKELIYRPYQVLTSLVNGVAAATFAKIQENPTSLRDYFKKMLRLACTIAMPIYAVMFIFAEAIVALLYAPSFSEVAFFLRVLSIVGMLTCIDGMTSPLQTSLGRTDLGFIWTTVRVVMSIVVILIASMFTIRAVAYGQLVVAILSYFLFYFFVTNKMVPMPLLEYMIIPSTSFFICVIIGAPFLVAILTLQLNYIWHWIFVVLFVALYALYYIRYQRSFVTSSVHLILGNKASNTLSNLFKRFKI